MPPEVYPPGSPREWLRRARSNLARARQPKPPEALWEDLCFDAQQAAEKAVKALLVARAIEFPKSHDIGRLLALLGERVEVPAELRRAAGLSVYAMAARYPSDLEPATEEDYRQALELAEAVVRWAERELQRG